MKITDVVAQMVGLLEPMPSEDRQRAVKATLTLLGENPPGSMAEHAASPEQAAAGPMEGVNPAAIAWMKQHGLSLDQLHQVFQISGGNVEVMGEMPGKNNKEKTINAYVLTGISRLVSTGESGFEDKLARAVCASAGCYDNTNHSKYLRDKGKLFIGSKSGWVLTQPGRKYGADLIKSMAQ